MSNIGENWRRWSRARRGRQSIRRKTDRGDKANEKGEANTSEAISQAQKTGPFLVPEQAQKDSLYLQEKKDKKKQRIVDYGVFEFDLPQDISKAATEITILSVELVKDDLDADEELPPGGKVKVLQIITQQKIESEEDNLLDVTERDVKIGN